METADGQLVSCAKNGNVDDESDAFGRSAG